MSHVTHSIRGIATDYYSESGEAAHVLRDLFELLLYLFLRRLSKPDHLYQHLTPQSLI